MITSCDDLVYEDELSVMMGDHFVCRWVITSCDDSVYEDELSVM